MLNERHVVFRRGPQRDFIRSQVAEIVYTCTVLPCNLKICYKLFGVFSIVLLRKYVNLSF
jgi:hypothetical protein